MARVTEDVLRPSFTVCLYVQYLPHLPKVRYDVVLDGAVLQSAPCNLWEMGVDVVESGREIIESARIRLLPGYMTLEHHSK